MIRPELDAAIAKSPWLLEADRAAVQLARLLADRVDALPLDADVRELTSLSKALIDVLDELGLTVQGRTGKPEAPKEVTPLDRLRDRQPTPQVVKQTAKTAKPRPSRKRTS